MANVLKTIFDAVCAAIPAKSKPEKLENNRDLYDYFAYDPYVKNEAVTDTIEKTLSAKLTISQDECEVEVGKFVVLTASIKPSAVGTVKWISSDETVATVENGTVVGIAEGTATITAKVDKFEATCEVTVNAVEENNNLEEGGNGDTDLEESGEK